MFLRSLSSNFISLLRNDGTGLFESSKLNLDGRIANSVALADVEGDGDLDLIASFSGLGTVSVFQNQGAFTAFDEYSYPAGPDPSAMRAEDVNGDEFPDILVANQAVDRVSILLNDTTGAFAVTQTIVCGDEPWSIGIGDLDKDGLRDLAVTNGRGDSVSIFYNLGAGVYSTGTEIPAGNFPRDIALADLDVDGFLDLLVTNFSEQSIFVYFGRSGGAFSSPRRFNIEVTSTGITAGDVNRDGLPDVAVSIRSTPGFEVLMNLGDRSLSAPLTYTADRGTNDVAFVDLNGDGALDLTGPANLDPRLIVHLNDGTGVFAQAHKKSTDVAPSRPTDTAFGDVDNDGDIDHVISLSGRDCGELVDAFIGVISNDGTGQYSLPTLFEPIGRPTKLHLHDMNGDGNLDLLAASPEGHLCIYDGEGDGTFADGRLFPALPGMCAFLLDDFDADGLLDALFRSTDDYRPAMLLRNLGNGAFGPGEDLAVLDKFGAIISAHFNDDHAADLALIWGDPKRCYVAMNHGDGTFGALEQVLPSFDWNESRYLAAGDIDLDGDVDLMVTEIHPFWRAGAKLCLNNGRGDFFAGDEYGFDFNLSAAAIADVNGDLRPDLLATGAGVWSLGVFVSSESGDFLGPFEYGGLTDNKNILVTDTDGDDLPEVVLDSQMLTSFLGGEAVLPPPNQPQLNVEADCPQGGSIHLTWSHATPDQNVFFLFSRSTGTTVIPPGTVCAGVMLQLSSTGLLQLGAYATGSGGTGQLARNLPAAACGGYLQLLDLGDCAVSPLVRIE